MGVVKIKDTLYQEIKDYCNVNNLKINDFVNDLIQKQFMIEKYGDVPFYKFNQKYINMVEEIPEEIQKVVNEHFDEMLNNDTDYQIKIVEPEKKEETSEPIVRVSDEVQKVIDEHMKALNDKNNKPSKRKLKTK